MTNPNNQALKPMTLEEARKVTWFKKLNPRPMGELLDEGLITRKNLEWAAETSWSDQIKQAAQVLLDSKPPVPQNQGISAKPTDITISVEIPVEQARATLWPFPPNKGQKIGALIDAKQLSLKDLGFAAQNAYDHRVRQAARTLLLQMLTQAIQEPKPSAGYLHIVSGGESYAERQRFKLSFFQGFITGTVLTAAVILSIWDFTSRASQAPRRSLSDIVSTPSGVGGLIIAILVIFAAGWLLSLPFDFIINWFDKQKRKHRRGQEAEEQTVLVMSQVLDGNWWAFQNMVLPGQRADLDIVLVGPPGVWVLEVKALTGEYRNIGDQWEFRAGNRWKIALSNPSRQARNNALRLKNFLDADGINQWVNGVVVWATPDSSPDVENPAVAVWVLERLADELSNIWQSTTIPEDKRQQIIDKLNKLCEKRRELLADED